MKSIIFDTGPIISLTLNHLMWTLELLKKQFGGEFYITKAVKEELVDRPLETKRFKFEALHTLRFIRKGVIKVYDLDDYSKDADEMMQIANKIYKAKGNYITVFHRGEIEVLALAKKISPKAIIIDERVSREIVEDPLRVQRTLEKRLHTRIEVNQKNLKKLREDIGKIKVLRSTELAIAAYDMGALERYLPDGKFRHETLLDSILWGIKMNGCAITEDDINSIIDIECRKDDK